MQVVGFLLEGEIADRPGYVLQDVGYQCVFGHDVKLVGDLDAKWSYLWKRRPQRPSMVLLLQPKLKVPFSDLLD